jgi:hypothetical protein
MRWKFLGVFASSVFVASGVGAVPASVEYVQETWYELTYYAPQISILLLEQQATEELPYHHYDALYDGETSEEMATFGHIVVESGLRSLDLNGQSIIFSSDGPRDYGDSWYDGMVSFGENNSVIDWEYSFVETLPVTVIVSTSEGRPLDISPYLPLHDASLVEGRTVYDQWYWEPTDAGFSTRPGWWSVSVGHSCYTTLDGVYQDEASCSTPTPVPLPLPGIALISAVAGLIALGKRRPRTAGAVA